MSTDRSGPLSQARADFAEVIDEIGARTLQGDSAQPASGIARLKRTGFGAVRVPAEFGGRGLRRARAAELWLDLAGADATVAHALRDHVAFVEDCLLQHRRGLDQSRWFRRFVDGEIVGAAVADPAAVPAAIHWADGRHVVNGRTRCSWSPTRMGTDFAEWIEVVGQFDGFDSYPAVAAVDVRQSGVVVGDSGTIEFIDARTDDVLPLELRAPASRQPTFAPPSAMRRTAAMKTSIS